jgi:uncharacterized RDD family membrane protein YckC
MLLVVSTKESAFCRRLLPVYCEPSACLAIRIAGEEMANTRIDATISSRFAAGVIDAAVVAILSGVAAKGAVALFGIAGWFSPSATQSLDRVVLILVFMAYSVLLPVCRHQGTLGQRWLGIEIVASDGARGSPGECLFRCLAFIAAVLPLGAGLLIGLAGERRPLQDRLCSTRVVQRERQGLSGPA